MARYLQSAADDRSWFDANSGWLTFASFVLAILAIGIGYYFWLRPRRSKRLGWEKLSGYRLVKVPDSQRDKLPLKLMYGHQEVRDPYILVLRVGNVGREEVRADDFDQPLTVDFDGSALLAFDVIDKSTTTIEPMFRVSSDSPNRIALLPLLLNGGEWIDIQCVTDGQPKRPIVTSRIAGESKKMLGLWEQSERSRVQLKTMLAFLPFPILAFLALSVFSEQGEWPMIALMAFLAGTLVGSIPLLDQVQMRESRAWRRKR